MIKLNQTYRVLILVAFTLLFMNQAFSQTRNNNNTPTPPSNSISTNLFGEGSLFSLNYEKLFFVRPKMLLSSQVGMGYNEEFDLFGNGTPSKSYLTLPHHLTFNYGRRRHFIEIGVSGTVVFGDTNYHYLLGPLLGYRLHPVQAKKVNVRIFGTLPFISWSTDIIYIPFGLSIGYCF